MNFKGGAVNIKVVDWSWWKLEQVEHAQDENDVILLRMQPLILCSVSDKIYFLTMIYIIWIGQAQF